MKDPIGALAETQADALSSLTESINSRLEGFRGANKKTLLKFNSDLDTYATEVSAGDAPSVLLQRKTDRKEYDRARAAEADEEYDSIEETELQDDPIFSSSNPFGIPDLLRENLCTEVPDSIWDRSDKSTTEGAWYCYSAGPGTIPESKERKGGFLGFFTEDFRFERCWNDTPAFTEWLRVMDFKGVVTPDFSTYSDYMEIGRASCRERV